MMIQIFCDCGNSFWIDESEADNVVCKCELEEMKAERDGDHPTEKPVALLSKLISVVVPEGGTVLDPFGGSGAIAEAAEMVGRKWVIIEVEKTYCDVIVQRMDTKQHSLLVHCA